MNRLKIACLVLLAALTGCPGSPGTGQNGNGPANSNTAGPELKGKCIVTCTTDRVRTEVVNQHNSFDVKRLLEKDKDSKGNFVFDPDGNLGCADYAPSEGDCKVLVKNY